MAKLAQNSNHFHLGLRWDGNANKVSRWTLISTARLLWRRVYRLLRTPRHQRECVPVAVYSLIDKINVESDRLPTHLLSHRRVFHEASINENAPDALEYDPLGSICRRYRVTCEFLLLDNVIKLWTSNNQTTHTVQSMTFGFARLLRCAVPRHYLESRFKKIRLRCVAQYIFRLSELVTSCCWISSWRS